MKSTSQNTTAKNYLYARFSSAEQAAGCSEADQIKQAATWCEARGETLSTPYFIARGVSAMSGANRDKGSEFATMLETVSKGDRVLLRDNDRFGRDNVLKALGHLQSIVEEKGISILILSTGVEINAENFNRPEILFPNFFKGFLAHDENEKKRGNILRALALRKAKIASGEVIRLNKEREAIQDCPIWVDSASWKLNAKAEIIVMIFDLYLGGMGPAAIARKFNKEGVRNFGTGKNAGKSWSQSVIYRLLEDRRTWGCKNNGTAQSKEWIKGYYPAAIDEDKFLLAQARREDNRGKATIARGDRAIVNLFSGVFKCSCGGAMRVSKN